MNGRLFSPKNRYKVPIGDALNSKNFKWERNNKKKKKHFMATQQGNVRINKTIRKRRKRFFFFFFFWEDVAKELRSRKRLLSLNFSWFKKSVVVNKKVWNFVWRQTLSPIPFAKPIRHHTNSPSFLLLYIYIWVYLLYLNHTNSLLSYRHCISKTL